MNEMLNLAADVVVCYLLIGSVAALILVPLALIIIKAARIRTPVYCHMIWFYALIGFVVLPLIWLYGPKVTFTILPTRADASEYIVSSQADDYVGATAIDQPPMAHANVRTQSATVVKPQPFQWRTAVAVVWLSGFAFMLTRLVVGWYRLRRICLSAAPATQRRYREALNDHTLTVRLTSQLPGPVCFGVFQPIILLPYDMYRDGTVENLRMVLAHELAHIERHDCWANLFQRIVEAMYFFHPLVWLTSWQLTQQREQICDNHVLAEGISPDDYTMLLLHIGERAVHARYLQTVALFEGQLLSRIRDLLDPLRSRQTQLPWRTAAVCTIAVLAGFLLFGSVRLAAQASDRVAGASPESPLSSSASVKQEPTQSPTKAAAADSEKSEQSRYAARTFNSKVALWIFAQETSGDDPRSIGHTPNAAPLEIPACWLWWVEPSVLVRDWNLVVREISENKVPGLRLYAATTDSDLKHLASLTELRFLDLSWTQITDAGLAHLRSLKGLEDLRLYGTHQVTDAGLEHIKTLTRLQRLSLTGTRITDAGLECLKGLTELRHLDLVYARITDGGLIHLKGLSQLQELSLSGTPITDEGLEHLKGLTGLHTLGLYGTQITSVGLACLEGLKGLRRLQLHETAITDAGLEHLKGLTKLEELSLMDTWITDAGLVHLQSLTGLRQLWLDTPGTTDAGLAHLECLTRLQDLGLGRMQITDAGLAHLKGLTALQGLWMSAPRVTDAGLAHLAAMPSVKWRSLGLDNTQITDGGLRHIEGMRELESLQLDGTHIGDAGLEHLKGLTAMERLYLSYTRITDAGLVHIEGLSKLQELLLRNTQITDAGLEHLKCLTELQDLRLDNTGITDAGLVNLKGLIRLKALWLDRTQITDAGLAYLTDLTGLEFLRLEETNVTDAGVQQLQQTLPMLTVVR